MDPRHLQQLATILDKGSITAASKHLCLTQPTLTRNMRVLEMQAGGQLFTRSRFGVRSTPLGEMLAREGRVIARGINALRESTARHRLGLRNQLRLAAGPLVGAAVLPGLVTHLLKANPGLALTIQTDRPHRLIDQLIDGEHDLVMAPSWLARPPQGIARFLLARDRIGVFCGLRHPLASRETLAAGDFDRHDWISLGTASPYEKEVFEMLSRVGIQQIRTEVATLGDAYVLLRLMVEGRHLAVLPAWPVKCLRESFPLVELPTGAAPTSRDLFFWCRESELDKPAFVDLKRSALAYVATLDGGAQGIEAA